MVRERMEEPMRITEAVDAKVSRAGYPAKGAEECAADALREGVTAEASDASA